MEQRKALVKETLWSKIKKIFYKNVLRNNTKLTNQDKTAIDEVKEAYENNEYVDETKIEDVEKVIQKSSDNIEIHNQDEEQKYSDNYKSVNVNGKDVRCYEENDGDMSRKRYVIIGEKEVIHTKSNNIDEKRCIVYGYTENKFSVRGISFTEKVRDKNLDMELSKIKITKQGKIEETSKGPLIDPYTEQAMGTYERKETNYQNGSRYIEEKNKLIDENGNKQTINETHSHQNGTYTHTKYLNGQVVFQLIRDEKGTVIKEYDNNGNVKDAYTYDKDGKPTETINVVGKDGKVRRRYKTYNGINEIPDDTLEPCNGVFRLSKEYENYASVLSQAGLPASINNIREKLYEEHISQSEIREFEDAKNIINAKEEINQSKQMQSQMEL